MARSKPSSAITCWKSPVATAEGVSGLEAQIVDLQTRVAYQDDTLQQLNDVIAAQQQQIERLTQAIQRLSEQMRDWREHGVVGGDDAPPPHY